MGVVDLKDNFDKFSFIGTKDLENLTFGVQFKELICLGGEFLIITLKIYTVKILI
jgi:hypothetical protein